MTKKISFLAIMGLVLLGEGCVKESYNMDKLSDKVQMNPALAVPGFRGRVTFSDLVKPGDTVVFDADKFVRVIFREDSVINLKLKDFYDFSNMVSYSKTFTMGDLTLSPFQNVMSMTLDEISKNFSATARSQFVALDDGTSHPFPSFPAVTVEKAVPVFSNFEYAVFASGFLDVTITNNLTAPLNTMNITLFNTVAHTQVGPTLVMPAVIPGETRTVSMNLAGLTVTNALSVSASISSPGNSTPVIISLANSNVRFSVLGRSLKVRSGRVTLPPQTVVVAGSKDTISFDPGIDIELDKLKVSAGNLGWSVLSTTQLSASISLTLPTAIRNSVPVVENINVNPSVLSAGNISFQNTELSLNADTKQPYNRVPFEYGLTVSSGNMVTFNSSDMLVLDLKLASPDFDYVKGYFGQKSETINTENVDFGIGDVLSKLSGDFLIANPSIKLNYSNSFGLPIQVSLNVDGKRGTKTVNLGLNPFTIAYPATLSTRDVTSSFIINKDNSSLPALISLPPENITFGGGAKVNPASDPGHLRNNYVFGNSRFLGSIEMEMPLQFRFKNFQLNDTIDNFMKSSNPDDAVMAANLDRLQFNIKADNGFPLGVSLSVSLYDSLTHTIKGTAQALDVLKPAPVDANGKVNGVTTTDTEIKLTSDFFKNVNKADKIILHFMLNSTDLGTKDVKIYSDYRIGFNARIVVKPEINLK